MTGLLYSLSNVLSRKKPSGPGRWGGGVDTWVSPGTSTAAMGKVQVKGVALPGKSSGVAVVSYFVYLSGFTFVFPSVSGV